MKKYIFNFMIILFIPLSVQALAKSASDTAIEFYNLVKQENYSAAAAYYDPVTLREFRQLLSFKNEITDKNKRLYFRTFFDPDLTDESIENLTDLEFFASFWRGVLSSDKFSQSINYKNVEILGEVKEKEDLAHVVTRNWVSIDENRVETVEVTSFNKIEGAWKIRMSGTLKSIAILLRQEFTKKHLAK